MTLMKDIHELSDTAILKAVGESLERMRREARIPDSEVVRRGGIKIGSWKNLKAGENVTMVNLIKALRGLGMLHLMEPLAAHESKPSPMELVRNTSSKVQRRFHRKSEESSGGFRWGDEE